MPATKPSEAMPNGSDWPRLARLGDDELEAMAAADIDNPATTEDDWAEAFVGPPPVRVAVHAKFDADVVNWFKARGPGHQARMNAVLRHSVEVQRKRG